MRSVDLHVKSFEWVAFDIGFAFEIGMDVKQMVEVIQSTPQRAMSCVQIYEDPQRYLFASCRSRSNL